MKHIALAALTAGLLSATAFTAGDPPVRIKLSDERLGQGDHERVHVKTVRDGYLVVLRMGEDGHVRVLFPLDPGDSNSIRGGREIEVRSRGDRDAFIAGEKAGTGLILAARSDTPFNFIPFETSHHWNPDALVPANMRDTEAALVSIVDAMTRTRYDYDAVPYSVEGAGVVRARAAGPYYDPWFYGAWGPWPYYYGPHFGFRTTIVIPIGRRRW